MTYLDRIHIYLEDLQWKMEDLQWRTGLKESIEEHLQQDKIDNLFLYTIIFTITKQYPRDQHWDIFYNITINKLGKE
jgi:hypothetical protein